MEIKNPRNMSRESIQQILCHWYERQEEIGPESAFRFLRHVGNKNKLLLANYPRLADDSGNGGRTDRNDQDRDNRSKAKGRKGKERQVDELDGLLPIDQMEEPVPRWHDDRSAGPSNLNGFGDTLVRVDMGQMKMLRDQGHNVLGPVNGPNEGLPQYEVPRSWLQFLPAEQNTAGPSSRPYPRPRPILPTNNNSSLLKPMDEISHESPSMPVPIESNPADLRTDTTHITAMVPAVDQNIPAPATPPASMLPAVDQDIPPPATPPASIDLPPDGPDPASHPTPKKRLGKRNQAQLSPQAKRQTRSSAKRKKIGDDERAAIEAKTFLTTTTRQRKKPNRD
jgi:hypothetical protein